ncbi:hypothetical protein Tco_1064113, partial [Tanacetum coccineum]
ADRLLHYKVVGRVDGLVDEVEGLEKQRAELVVELVNKIVKEVTEVSGKMEALTKSLTSLRSSLSNCNTYFLPSLLNSKDYDGKGGAIAYTHWIEKIESVQDMSGCGDNQKVKYTTGSFTSKALT